MSLGEQSIEAAARHPGLTKYLQGLRAREREKHIRRILRCLRIGVQYQLTEIGDFEDFGLIVTGFRAGYLKKIRKTRNRLH